MKRLVAGFVAGAIFVLGGVAVATIPDGQGVIHGCYKNNSGVVRIIDDSVDTCTSQETAITWSQTGPAGQDGTNGIDGQDGSDATATDIGDVVIFPRVTSTGTGQCQVGGDCVPVQLFLSARSFFPLEPGEIKVRICIDGYSCITRTPSASGAFVATDADTPIDSDGSGTFSGAVELIWIGAHQTTGATIEDRHVIDTATFTMPIVDDCAPGTHSITVNGETYSAAPDSGFNCYGLGNGVLPA